MDRQQSNLEQIFSPVLIHQEEEPDIEEVNDNTSKISKDIVNIDNVMIESANKLKNLLDNTKLRLSNIKEYLNCNIDKDSCLSATIYLLFFN